MTAQIIKFPNFFRPATPRDEPCLILVLPTVPVERIECPKIALLRKQSKLLREHFKATRHPAANMEREDGRQDYSAGMHSHRGRQYQESQGALRLHDREIGQACEEVIGSPSPKFSGGTCSGGEG